jgi:hypothetical protein
MIKKLIEVIKNFGQSLWNTLYPPIRTKLSGGEVGKPQIPVVATEIQPADSNNTELTREIVKLRETIAFQKEQDEKKLISENERKENQRRFEVLLALIGLWLALPQTCAIAQRIVDTLTSLDYFTETIAISIKLLSDTCLFSFFIFGLVFLIAFVPVGYFTVNIFIVVSRFFINLTYSVLSLFNVAKGLQKWLLDKLDRLDKKVKERSMASVIETEQGSS